ncbi:hypothetical protein [Victivallis sp. Marseille-Q1083]|uniref:hypothetical protein n=1 Tax=Victivallis sp. Marseille-Q1083 TaxID=2717288 RepID=UPI00158D00A1|nr:hypothetical protein [Victivallis sp. Marseille-Q1083]
MDMMSWCAERDAYLKQLEQLIGCDGEAGNLAFHLTEIGTEVSMLNEIHERLLQADNAEEFKRQLDAFFSTVCVHWQYHINYLNRLYGQLAVRS